MPFTALWCTVNRSVKFPGLQALRVLLLPYFRAGAFDITIWVVLHISCVYVHDKYGTENLSGINTVTFVCINFNHNVSIKI